MRQRRTAHLLESSEVKGALELAKVVGPDYQPPGGFLRDWLAVYDESGK